MLRDLDGNASIIRREMQMRRHDGDEFTAMLHLTRMRHGGQDAVQIMFEDISQRKSEEFELTASHQLLQSLIDGMPEFIALKDAEGRYLFVNKVFEEWYGISRAQAIGTTLYDYLSQDEADLSLTALIRLARACRKRLSPTIEYDRHRPDEDVDLARALLDNRHIDELAQIRKQHIALVAQAMGGARAALDARDLIVDLLDPS